MKNQGLNRLRPLQFSKKKFSLVTFTLFLTLDSKSILHTVYSFMFSLHTNFIQILESVSSFDHIIIEDLVFGSEKLG